jgi:hypothetical protein
MDSNSIEAQGTGNDAISTTVASEVERLQHAVAGRDQEIERLTARINDLLATNQRHIDAATIANTSLTTAFSEIGEAALEHLGDYSAYQSFFDAVHGELPTGHMDDLFAEHFGKSRDIDVDIEYEPYLSGTVYTNGTSIDISESLDAATISCTLSDVPAHIKVEDIEDPEEYGGPEANFSVTEGDLEIEFSLSSISES